MAQGIDALIADIEQTLNATDRSNPLSGGAKFGKGSGAGRHTRNLTYSKSALGQYSEADGPLPGGEVPSMQGDVAGSKTGIMKNKTSDLIRARRFISKMSSALDLRSSQDKEI